MRVGPIAHGALLVAALGFAYQTWTREKTETPKVGTVSVWSESLDAFESFAYDGDNKSVRVERRGEGDDSYYWGQVTRTEKKKKPKVPVKAPATDAPTAPGGHGSLPGMMPGKPGAAAPGKPGAAPGAAAPGKPGAPGTAAPKPATPAKPGAATPPGHSPHQAGSGEGPDQPATPSKPATPPKPAAPPKPATPAAPGSSAAPASPAAGGGEDSADDDDQDSPEPGAPDDAAEEPEETTSSTKEFPIGKGGRELIQNLVDLHALRDLGVLTDQQKEDYELNEATENLTVFFKGGKKHSLILGARIFGGGDRYVVNPDTGRGYVLSNSEIMRHIDGAENSLAPKALHGFQEENVWTPGPDDPDDKAKKDKYNGVAQIQVETSSGSRSLIRYEQPDPTTGNTIVGWADKQTPKQADVTFGNLLTQIERLRPVEYDTSLDVSSLTKVMTLSYASSAGKTLGTFELYKKDAPVTPAVEPADGAKKENEATYYVKTELTRVPGKVGRMLAERVTDDLPQLFGAPPKEKKDEPPDNPLAPPVDKTEAPKGGSAPAPAPAGKSP